MVLALQGPGHLVVPGLGTEPDADGGCYPDLVLPPPPDPSRLWDSDARIGIGRVVAVMERVPAIRQPRSNRFDWVAWPDDGDGGEACVLACPEVGIGHQHSDRIAFACSGDRPLDFVLKVEIWARNLDGPFRADLPVTVEPVVTGWSRASFTRFGTIFQTFEP